MNQLDIDTQALKFCAPIIPYIKQFYKDKIEIKRETDNVAFAKCIFHQENTASLAFYANGTYKCFGCGEHGDLITLVQKIENVDFQSACIIIANNVGFKIDYINTNPIWEQYKDALDDFSRRYWKNLQNDVDALNYVTNIRQISSEMINKFRLGLTDVNEYMYRKDMGNISHRLAFPILEHKRISPKCVGMAYRGFTDEKPKYVNDKNQTGQENQNLSLSGVFIKGNMLYGLAQSYSSISKSNFAFVVEGYFDVISMHQAGFTNTVGLMGTSFSEEQIKALSKVTKNIFLLLDNDNAGRNAMEKHISELIKYDLKPMICLINDFKDPDEMCKTFGFDNAKIYQYLNGVTKDGIYYLIQNGLSSFKEIVSRERVKTYSNLYNIIQMIPNIGLRNAYLKEIEKELY